MKTFLTAPTLTRISFLLTLISIGFTFQGCGYFSREDANFSKDVEVPLDFPAFDADALCPSTNEACNQEPVASPESRELEPIDINIDINVADATGVSELSQYAGKFESITVSKIEYEVSPNTLTFDLPELTLYLAPAGTESITDAAAVPFATIPMTPAGMEVKGGQATIIEENDQKFSDLLKTLQVAALAGAQPVVKQGQEFPPSGKAEIKATIFVNFTANPLDAAGL